MDIAMHNMLQSLLLRPPLTSANTGSSAQIEELPSTFSEDGQYYQEFLTNIMNSYFLVLSYVHCYNSIYTHVAVYVSALVVIVLTAVLMG